MLLIYNWQKQIWSWSLDIEMMTLIVDHPECAGTSHAPVLGVLTPQSWEAWCPRSERSPHNLIMSSFFGPCGLIIMYIITLSWFLSTHCDQSLQRSSGALLLLFTNQIVDLLQHHQLLHRQQDQRGQHQQGELMQQLPRLPPAKSSHTCWWTVDLWLLQSDSRCFRSSGRILNLELKDYRIVSKG